MKLATQLGLLAAVCCAAFTARADVLGDYKVILDRNPFGLKPPPPPPPPPPTNAEPTTPTNYKLSGITALFNPPRAMFVNQIPGKPAPEYVSLSEGQRQGSIEVLPAGINLKEGTVRVKISGEERTLSFAKDGLKAAAGPPVMTAPGVPVPFGRPNPVPPTPGGTMIPAPSMPTPSYNQPAPAPTATPAVIPVPTQLQRPVRTVPLGAVDTQPSPPPAPKVDAAEQALRMEIQRQLDQPKVVAGDSPPLPPTDLSGR